MVRAGEEIVDPAAGLRMVFRETALTTGGTLLQVDWICAPGWTTGPDHLHPQQEERLEVLCGRLGTSVGGVELTHGPGEVVAIPAGAPHRAWNAGEGDVHLLVDFRPALRTEAALETLAGLARAGKTMGHGGPRNPLRLALLLREFDDEFRLARPPVPVQRVLFGALAAIGRLAGLRGEHPYDRQRAASWPAAASDRKESEL